ncbi:MAG: cation:proton antiporter [Planctomycetota bacterium]|nr:cation:proton antiporter [Planctomycetota bacterium]
MLSADLVLLLVVQIGLILALSRVMGAIFVRIRQPQVMGEMIAGIMLGPSLFGLLLPRQFADIFPKESVAYLNVLSEVGIILFLFLIGLELDPKLLRKRGNTAIIISNASIVTPMILGSLLALFLYHRVFPPNTSVRFASFALFMGAAMSVTAFPVLARILTERNMHRTQVGAVAITCAAVDDVCAWCLLAFVVAVARASGLGPGLWTAFETVIYVGIMFFAVRPFLRRLELVFESSNGLSQNLLAIILLLVLASAVATECIGIHALFGAFLMGAIMPKNTRFVRTLTEKLEDITVVLLLPVFFAFTGLRTRLGLLDQESLWFYTILILLVACIGKFGGSTIAARVCGMSWRDASAIGVLMNTRGLMELVILNVGRDLGVIPETVFAMMVLMALITTALTTPILHWVHPHVELEAEAAAKTGLRAFSVLIPISLPASGGPLTAMAALLAPALDLPRKILTLHLKRPSDHDPYAVNREEAQSERADALEPVLAAAKEKDIAAESIAFVSRDVPSDIARVARLRGVDLILMGFHKPVFGKAILGGTVHRVMTASDSDVAVFVNRGLGEIKTVLAPYLGGKHDRLALEMAGRVARNSGAALTVLHVVPPRRANSEAVLHARTVVEKTFAEPQIGTPVNFQVIEDSSPVDAVLKHLRGFDLVVIGVEEQWGMQSHLFGWRPERIARAAQTSMLIVRKFTGPKLSSVDNAAEPMAVVHS